MWTAISIEKVTNNVEISSAYIYHRKLKKDKEALENKFNNINRIKIMWLMEEI